MKKSGIVKQVLFAGLVAPFLMGCPKAKTPVAPQPDEEVQSSVEATQANFIVSDLEMLCSFIGENDRTPDFYVNTPESPVNYTVIDIGTNRIAISFNKNACLDGKERHGTILMDYSLDDPNARYYRNYRFKGEVSLESYKVGEWEIKTVGGPLRIYNQLKSSVYNTSETRLSWLIEGNLELNHATDPSKNMTWNGRLVKTLVNTGDPAVFNPSRQEAIKWANAKVAYTGEVSGFTSGNVPYKMTINEARPLVRDFTCNPDVVGGVSSVQPLKTWKQEYHPFTSGIASLTTGDKYPRQIYYGNEGEPQLPAQCDNSGEVLIKGNSYPIDFAR